MLSNSSLKVIVLGAGAIGCYVGARLAAAQVPVSLVGRPRVLQALAAHGLRVSDQQGFDHTVAPASLHLADSLGQAMAQLSGAEPVTAEQWVILVCTKATGTLQAAAEIAEQCSAGATVISLQNGVENPDLLRGVATQMTVLAGMVPFTVNWQGDHHVYQANQGNLFIERHPRSEALAGLLQQAGLVVDLRDDMPAVLWGKLLVNLFNPINALANLPISAQLRDRGYRQIWAALQEEGLRAVQAAGIQPAKVTKVAPAALPKILRLPNWLFVRVAAAMLRTDPQARTSMCQDLQSGRLTEIDNLCGALVRLADRHQVPANFNRRMIELITAHQPGSVWTAQSLQRALHASS